MTRNIPCLLPTLDTFARICNTKMGQKGRSESRVSFLQAIEPNTLLLDNALATMGAGLPSAMAVALLNPEKKVLAVAGDGGFMMNSQVSTGAFAFLLIFLVLFLSALLVGS